MSKIFECSLTLVVEAETHEEAAAVFDAWAKDPHGNWAYRVTDTEDSDSRLIDSEIVNLDEHYPE